MFEAWLRAPSDANLCPTLPPPGRKCAAGLDESGQLVASRGVGGGDHPPRCPAMSRVSEVLPLDSRSSVGRSG
jgi:hypothetical protein